MTWLKPLNPRGQASAGDNHDTQVAWLRVVQGQANGTQIADARKVFARHLGDISLSLAGYHAVNYKLPDGSRMRVVSNGGIHQVDLWPVGAAPKVVLPHGFAVVTNWASPKIFKRRTDPSVTPRWITDPTPVPQARVEIESDSQVFLASGSGPFLNHPMVLTRAAPRKLWDYLQHSGPTAAAGENPVVPVDLSISGNYKTKPVHYGFENTLLGPTGTVIYTMSLSATITASDDVLAYAPAGTTADATQVVLQHIRSAILSPTFGIYEVACANERLTRTAPTTYTLADRNEAGFVGPIGSATPPGGSAGSSLGENIDPDEFFAFVGVVGAGGSSSPYSWSEGFYFAPIDLSGAVVETETATSEQLSFVPDAADTYADTVALAAAAAVDYPLLTAETNVAGLVQWRAGFVKSIVDPSLSPLLSTRWYGNYGYRKDRIDTMYSMTATPVVKYALGWCDLKLLEGATGGTCAGQTHVDTKWEGKSASLWDGDVLSNTWIVPPEAAPFKPMTGILADILAWLAAYDIKPAVAATVAPFPNWTTTAATTVTTIVDTRPSNTGGYTYTSRYVIDFDHKGQFYAAIKVVVGCSGAEWGENRAVYDGFMEASEDPDYTVTISLETNWKGTVASTVLTTVTGSHPPFEFATLSKQNPYYFLSPGDADKQTMLVRVPPTIGLAYDGTTQLKTICSHQGVTDALACADVRADITGDDVAKSQSAAGIEFSTVEDGRITPHTRYVTGQLYARTFRLSDFPDALWLLHSTKCDATLNDAGAGADYYYMPALKTTIDTVDFHVEVRDGVHETWSDDFMPGASQPADPLDRDIKLYRV